MRRIVASLMLIIFMIALATSAYAVEPRASLYINSTGIARYAQSGGVVKFTADITGTDVMDKIGFTSIKIQVYTGSAWSTVKTVTNKFAYDKISYAYSTTYSGTAGKQYRAVVSYRAELDGGYDTRTRTSSSITAAS